MYFGAVLLGAYIFVLVISFRRIDSSLSTASLQCPFSREVFPDLRWHSFPLSWILMTSCIFPMITFITLHYNCLKVP